MKRGRRRIRRRCSSSKPPLFLLHQRLAPTRQDETRLLGASFKKTDEKPTANTYATERKRLNSGSERTFGPFMHGFHMIGFQRKGALFVLYPCSPNAWEQASGAGSRKAKLMPSGVPARASMRPSWPPPMTPIFRVQAPVRNADPGFPAPFRSARCGTA